MLDDKIGRFLHDKRDFCWPILLTVKIGQLYRLSDIPFRVV